MSKINDIFVERIDRPIQGVINVDDISNIAQELKEYVVTDDLVNQFDKFYTNFNDSIGIGKKVYPMAAWISGYFGSGKSHFLKILSYLLDNIEIDGKKSYVFFKEKLQSDPTLYANIERAAKVSKDVMLFNIDSKTQSNIKKDKILSVFERVFNEKIGFSFIPYVAEFERYLDDNGKYEEFKKNYKDISGLEWEKDRRFFINKMDEITECYCITLGKSKEEANNWFIHIQDNYSVTIEEFSKKVAKYIEKKGNDHHIIFMVDEVGQYIGGDRELTLNLQSIVEELGSNCGGKAWVVVTSQEDINSLVKVIKDDHSKIQDRFQTKISLSSKDVSEIIKKRLLLKKDESTKELSKQYDKNSVAITNLLSFSNASYSQSMLYADSKDFAETYPFVPYQFTLLQEAFVEVREQRFAREHLSSGERSLLGAFQDAAVKYKEGDIGTIIPFYGFYDTIENFLNHQIKLVFKKAEDALKGHAIDELGFKILKVLFMIKNVKGLPANVDNISILCIDNLDEDKLEFKKEVIVSLEKLERENLIQKYESEYRFLTNDEQEVNRAIQQMQVDNSDYTNFLKKRIFEVIYPEKKFINYNKQLFEISRYIDDKNLYGIDYDIGIKIWTGNLGSDAEKCLDSSKNPHLLYVDLDLDKNTIESINNILKVDAYAKANSSKDLRNEIADIITSKRRENDNLVKIVTERIREELKSSSLMISGNEIAISKQSIEERFNEGLGLLVKNVFTKLSYIETNFSSKSIREDFEDKTKGFIYGEKNTPNEKAYKDIKEYLIEESAYSRVVTIKSLLNHFESKPYGFIDDDIEYLIMRLVKDEEINLIYANNKLSSNKNETVDKIINRQYHEKVIIKIREKISQDVLVKTKNFLQEEFNVILSSENEDDILNTTIETITKYIDRLRELIGRYANYKTYIYPGKTIIEETIKYYDLVLEIRKDPQIFFKELIDVIDKLKSLHQESKQVIEFFGGKQVELFDKASETANLYLNNIQYLGNEPELNNSFSGIDEILKSESPYDSIQDLEKKRRVLVDLMGKVYEKQSEPAIENIKARIKNMNELVETVTNKDRLKEYVSNLEKEMEKLERSSELKEIYASKTYVENIYEGFLNSYNKVVLDEKKGVEISGKNEAKKQKKMIQIKSLIKPPVDITNANELDDFLGTIKDSLSKELNDGNDILII